MGVVEGNIAFTSNQEHRSCYIRFFRHITANFSLLSQFTFTVSVLHIFLFVETSYFMSQLANSRELAILVAEYLGILLLDTAFWGILKCALKSFGLFSRYYLHRFTRSPLACVRPITCLRYPLYRAFHELTSVVHDLLFIFLLHSHHPAAGVVHLA